MELTEQLAEELKIRPKQVEETVKLLDGGATVPFIARYRKEATGGLDDTTLRHLTERLEYLRGLDKRKKDVLERLVELGKWTEALNGKVKSALTLQEVEDLYEPYRPKRRTRAMAAREKGLEGLARMLQNERVLDVAAAAQNYVNSDRDVNSPAEALAGARDILAEEFAEDAGARGVARREMMEHGMVKTSAKDGAEDVYQMYFDYAEPIRRMASHRVLAVNRGEREGSLKVELTLDDEALLTRFKRRVKFPGTPGGEEAAAAIADGYKRLFMPAIVRQVRHEMTRAAEEQAIAVFGMNLKQLLMQPPLTGKVVMGVDPGFRTGCKIAVVDPSGRVLATSVVYMTLEHHDVAKAKRELAALMNRFQVDVVAIGNGTASRQSEKVVAEVLRELPRKVSYTIVSEAGASVYSASELAAKEFPDYDVSLRSAVSIARRLQDPLSELVKIEPRAIGVGQYQHDVEQKRLAEVLDGVVEDSVNAVGVDVNTASVPLLRHVAGITPTLAQNIVRRRETEGPFTSRKALKKVEKLGPKAFEQCAGFLRVLNGEEILDATGVHPESYKIARELLKELGAFGANLKEGTHKVPTEKELPAWAERLKVGLPTLTDIVRELEKPGRDIRENLPPVLLKGDVLEIEDVKPGMKLTGTVRNVVDFGAFVDIGVHRDGFVHVSKLSEHFVKHPSDVVRVGQVVEVTVLDVDLKKNRISLSMKEA